MEVEDINVTPKVNIQGAPHVARVIAFKCIAATPARIVTSDCEVRSSFPKSHGRP